MRSWRLLLSSVAISQIKVDVVYADPFVVLRGDGHLHGVQHAVA